MSYEPLNVLPVDIQRDFMATLQKAVPTEKGAFRLVNIRRAEAGHENQRITALVIDENGFPMPNILMAFAFSTAKGYVLSPDFLWNPPPPQRAFIVPTEGSGQVDMVLGPEGVVKSGEPGGVTAYVLEPQYSSDVVTGLGMLADHTGLHLTFQLRRTGIMPLMDRVAALEERVTALENVQSAS